MEKLGVQGPFQLVREHMHTKLWKLVPWYLVRLGNLDGVAAVQCSVDVPMMERGSAAAQARPRIARDSGLPWGFAQPFGSFQGALWCCGHTEARQNNRTCSTSSKRM